MNTRKRLACLSLGATLGLSGCASEFESETASKQQALSETSGLDLEIWSPGHSPQETRLAARVTNTSAEPVALNRVTIKAWLFVEEGEELVGASYGNNQTIYGPDGQWLANVARPTISFETLPEVKDCGGGRQANRVAIISFTDTTEIPAGGYLQTNPWGDSLVTWRRSDWGVLNTDNDYSRVQDAGNSASSRAHLGEFAVYLDDGLVCEGNENSGREPCETTSCSGSGAGDSNALPGNIDEPLAVSGESTLTPSNRGPEEPAADAPDCGETPELDLRVRQILATNNDKQYRFQVLNRGGEEVNLEDLSVKLWLAEGSELKVDVYNGGLIANAAGTIQPGTVSAQGQLRRFADVCDLEPEHLASDEVKLTAGSRALGAGETWTDLLVSVHRSDWSNFQSDDVSYSKLPAYQNGQTGDRTWPSLLGDDERFVLYYKGRRVSETSSTGQDEATGREPLCVGTCLVNEEERTKINADVEILMASSVAQTARLGIHSLTPEAAGPAALLLVRTTGTDSALTRVGASDVESLEAGRYTASVPLHRLPELISEAPVHKKFLQFLRYYNQLFCM